MVGVKTKQLFPNLLDERGYSLGGGGGGVYIYVYYTSIIYVCV